MKSGIIYKPGESRLPVSIRFAVMILKTSSVVLGWVGALMISISILGMFFVYLPLGIAETRYAISKTQVARVIAEINRDDLVRRRDDLKQRLELEGKKLAEIDTVSWEIPDKNYSIYIPKISAVSPVIGNVDANNAKTYLAALKKGVAEAAGLAHPGIVGTTFLFAHSVGSRVDFARYNAVFYLLEKMTVGDEIQIAYQGRLFKYEMVQREILKASDTKYLVPQNLSEKLVLQTCYPPGTTWKRLVIVAKRV